MAAVECTLKFDNMDLKTMIWMQYGTKRRKLIDLWHHILQNLLCVKRVQIVHVRYEGQKDDMFKKVLQRVKFNRRCTHMNIGDVASNGGSVTEEYPSQ